MRRFSLLGAAAVCAALVAGTGTATASVTLGQLSPLPTAQTKCNGGPFDALQPTVTDGNSYVVPSTGGVNSWKVTSWSHKASADSGQSLTMKFWRPLGGSTYMAVGHDGPRSPTPGTLNTYGGLNIPVKAGDVLGISPDGFGGNNACAFDLVGDQFSFIVGSLADGQSGTLTGARPDERLNVTAVIEPVNTFTLGSVTRNKKKGTATIAINDIPNPGELAGSGKGANVASTGKAGISKSVGTGAAQLLIKAQGKQKKSLNQKGKVKLNVEITYTPTGGSPNTQSIKINLKKKL